jgi:hypothetical protein
MHIALSIKDCAGSRANGLDPSGTKEAFHQFSSDNFAHELLTKHRALNLDEIGSFRPERRFAPVEKTLRLFSVQ